MKRQRNSSVTNLFGGVIWDRYGIDNFTKNQYNIFFLSHFHADHYLGLDQIQRPIRIYLSAGECSTLVVTVMMLMIMMMMMLLLYVVVSLSINYLSIQVSVIIFVVV